MTDIVERLKNYANDQGACVLFESDRMMLEAAAEIQSLRAEVERLNGLYKEMLSLEGSEDIIGRLRLHSKDVCRDAAKAIITERFRVIEFKKENATLRVTIDRYEDRIKQAISEVDRYRAAIKSAVTEQLDHICWLDVYQKLAALVGVEFNPLLLSEEQHMTNCRVFYKACAEKRPYSPDAITQKVTELERENLELTKKLPCWVSQQTAPTEEAFQEVEKFVREFRSRLQDKSEEIAYLSKPIKSGGATPFVLPMDVQKARKVLNQEMEDWAHSLAEENKKLRETLAVVRTWNGTSSMVKDYITGVLNPDAKPAESLPESTANDPPELQQLRSLSMYQHDAMAALFQFWDAVNEGHLTVNDLAEIMKLSVADGHAAAMIALSSAQTAVELSKGVLK